MKHRSLPLLLAAGLLLSLAFSVFQRSEPVSSPRSSSADTPPKAGAVAEWPVEPPDPAVSAGAQEVPVSPQVRERLLAITAHPDHAIRADIFDPLQEAGVGENIVLELAGQKFTGRLDSRLVSGEIRHFGVTLDRDEGRMALSLRNDGRLFGHVFFEGEGRVVALRGDKTTAAGWTLNLAVLSGVACCKPGTVYQGAGEGETPAPPAPRPDGPEAALPILNSRPGATHVIYLDFDGEVVTHPQWNGGNTINALPHPRQSEAAWVTSVWKRVVEDWVPFEINVSTERAVFNAAAPGNRVHVVITPSNTAAPGSGGVAAYIGSYPFDVPCWVFNLGEYDCADTISHEVGHTVGLRHDGRNLASGSLDTYYGGHGTGSTGWAPIMGAPWSDESPPFVWQNVTQWSRGEYDLASNLQDDLAVIASPTNGFGYHSDDHGDSLPAAENLLFSGSTVLDTGGIGHTDDADWFRFFTNGGSANLQIRTLDVMSTNYEVASDTEGANLAVDVRLYLPSGVLLEQSNPTDTLNAGISRNLTQGTYYLRIAGAGRGNPATSGFSSYASLGQYTVTGTVENLSVPGGTLQFSATSLAISEDGDEVVATVTRAGGSTGTVGVTFNTSNGTATSGQDYAATHEVLSWAAGDTSSRTVTIPVFDDDQFEGNETVHLNLSNPTGGAMLGAPSSILLTVEEDDSGVPDITSALAASGVKGRAFNFPVTATKAPTAFWATGLPPGLSIHSATGLITGAPAASGSFTVTLSASNAHGAGSATLQIVIIPPSFIENLLATDPGWSREGEWAFGSPAGGGGTQHGEPDPTSGATGSNVFGVALAGDHSTFPGGPPHYLTAGPFDFTGRTGVSLGFQRWLNSDYEPYVSTTIEVSNDGFNWTKVWSNGTSSMTATTWSFVTHDISAVADGNPAVYVRWGHQVGQFAFAYSGWNLDDVGFHAASRTVVTTTADENNGNLSPSAGAGVSFREALLHAPAESIISFAPALAGQTISLTLGQITVTKNLQVEGPAAGPAVIVEKSSGSGLARLLEVQSGRVLALRDLHLRHGSVSLTSSTAGNGGGIANHGTLHLSRCTLSDCSGRNGGAIDNNGTLTLDQCTVRDNTSAFNGAGIDSSGPLTVTRCTFAGNEAGENDGGGGAIQHTSGLLTVESSTFSGNSAAYGGAIDGDGTSVIELVSSTLSGNVATKKGGAIEETTGTLRMWNCIVSGNTCLTASGADSGGPDLFADIDDQPGTTSQGVNLVGSLEKVSGGFDGIVGLPQLAPLGDHGGPTLTRPPLAGSPAIHAGMVVSQVFDQRGFRRSSGPAPDLGAVEVLPATVIVTTLDDDGAGSLRDAVNQVAPAGTIGFAAGLAGGVIELDSGSIAIGMDVVIDATAAPGVAVSGYDIGTSIFRIEAGIEASITALALKNGQGDEGGAIHNAGSLTLVRCAMSGSEAVLGGALHNSAGGILSLIDCQITGNSADAGGACSNEGSLFIDGGIVSGNYSEAEGGALHNAGTANLTDTVMSGNQSDYFGGAIWSNGTLSIARSTVARNEAHENGGGIVVSGGQATLIESTVSENRTGGFGGGIWHVEGVVEIVNSTLARNRAEEGAGGAIHAYDQVILRQSTVADNDAGMQGGGVYLDEESQLLLRGSIVAANRSPDGSPDLSEVAIGLLVDQGNNLVGSAEGVLSPFSGLVADPLLLPFGVHGGPTPTMPPSPGSPAIDAGGTTSLLTDQRGFARVVGGAADIGAVETGNAIPALVVNTTADENNGAATGGVSLREAIAEVPVGGVVTFAPSLSGQSLALVTGPLEVTRMLAIDASGLVSPVTLSGDVPRGIHVPSSVHASLRSLRIAGFYGFDSESDGAGVFNQGSLLLERCEFDQNVGMDGGGVHNEGSLQAFDCVFSDNESAGDGGALSNDGVADLARCRLVGNGSSNAGAAIRNTGSIRLSDSWVSGNWANTSGGGIENQGTASILRCTFSSNHAEGSGGGGISNDGHVEVASSTITGNEAHFGTGGGISNGSSGTLRVLECTIAANINRDEDGGCGIADYSENFLLRNSIVANNTGPTQTSDIQGPIDTQEGGNLVSSTAGIGGGFNGIAGDPLLAPLGDYGGPTPTMPPQAGSPAIDAGGESDATVDQRGLARLVGLAIDLGSVEVQGISLRVTTANDSGPGSLRTLLAAAPSGATIGFDGSLDGQFIVLTGGPLVIGRNVEVDGGGLPAGITLSGATQSRVVEVLGGAEVVLANLNIAYGKSTGGGGAIHNTGQLTLLNTTVCRSLSFLSGGAIWNSGGLVTLVNSTVAGNFAAYAGGGVFNEFGSIICVHSTISANTAFFNAAGGIGNVGFVRLENSIVSGNSAPNHAFDHDYDFQNYSGYEPGQTGANFLGGNAKLAPLGYYGSALMVMPPLPGSPVVEAGVLLPSSTPALDQLGHPRPGGPLPDIGAVEAVAFATLGLADTDGDGIPDLLESAYGLTVGTNDSGIDADGDGSPDAEEIGNMTDPGDPRDLLRILTFERAAGFHPHINPAFIVTFPSFPGLSYTIEADLNLDFTGPDRTTVIAPFQAVGRQVETSVILRPGKDFIRVRRD